MGDLAFPRSRLAVFMPPSGASNTGGGPPWISNQWNWSRISGCFMVLILGILYLYPWEHKGLAQAMMSCLNEWTNPSRSVNQSYCGKRITVGVRSLMLFILNLYKVVADVPGFLDTPNVQWKYLYLLWTHNFCYLRTCRPFFKHSAYC